MSEIPMQLKCAWHPKYWGEQLVMREGDPKRVSHGICAECREIVFPAFEQRIKESLEEETL